MPTPKRTGSILRSGRVLVCLGPHAGLDEKLLDAAIRDAGSFDYVSSKGVRSNTGLGLPQARAALAIQSRDFELVLSAHQPAGGASFELRLPESRAAA